MRAISAQICGRKSSTGDLSERQTGFSPILGWFAGSIYDEDLQVPASLGWYRVLCAAALGSGLLGANWLLIQQHAGQPHADAVRQREFERSVRAIERDLDDIKQELRTIRRRLELPPTLP